ncbi:MAG: RHS repeat-associated core domain-containing protein [Actinomycetota bacterium]|nr:RHS repeat-associated core domain-containing protein [Actinomycetota bacterium]
MALAYNIANQTSSITPAGGGAAVPFEYASDDQDERTKKGATDYQNTVLGLSSEAASGATTRHVRDEKGALVAQRSGSAPERQYPLFDQLGSVVALTDGSGAVDRRFTYKDPYGEDVPEQVIDSGSKTTPYRFAGEYLDTETGLYKIGQRYYAPTLGRWTQRDPVDQIADPRQANPYLYAAGDPVNLTDPSGQLVPALIVGASLAVRAAPVVIGAVRAARGIRAAAAGARAAPAAPRRATVKRAPAPRPTHGTRAGDARQEMAKAGSLLERKNRSSRGRLTDAIRAIDSL